MATFLLEIGTEELPAEFSRQVISQLREKALADLNQMRVVHGNILCSSTPRRIFLLVENICELAKDYVEERKGPPEIQAFNNGSPTSAAIGFAKSCGVNPNELQIRDTPKGPFVFAKIIEKGKPVDELLISLVPKWIGDLHGSRFMRWSTGERRFSRPIRWIVCLLDQKLIPISILGCNPEIKSGNQSRGHRLFQESLTITSPSEYISTLEKNGVQVDRARRQKIIQNLIDKAANEYKSFPDLPHELLEELTDLVELPSLVCGQYDDLFLNLPPEVLTTVMRSHQRYIPLYITDKSEVDPLALNSKNILNTSFLCISNGLNVSNKTVTLGNQTVLKARLSDAKFFEDADLAISSSMRCELLKKVSFSEGLGSLFDRVKRIEWIVEQLIKKIKIKSINSNNAFQAARLCKHDLVSQMVGEFPELEGIIGGKYLLKEGEPREVALAVLEHYLPRFTGDSLPSSNTGAVLALAERFELLMSIFSKGERPSGSSDPYALRRAGNGILQILWDREWEFDLNNLLQEFINHWASLFPEFSINQSQIFNDLTQFFRQRIISLLEDEGIDIDLINAVTGDIESISSLLCNPSDTKLRASVLSKMRESNILSSLQLVVTRASRIAENSQLPLNILEPEGFIDAKLFEKQSEFELYKVISSLEPISKSKSKDRYFELAKVLIDGSIALANFFDGEQSVMVMTDNLKIRFNRLNLLAIIRNQARVLADFDQIST